MSDNNDDNVNWQPTFTDDDLERQAPNERLAQAVFQAIGAASMCWESVNNAGVFRSDLARSIGDGLLEFIREHGEWSLVKPDDVPDVAYTDEP